MIKKYNNISLAVGIPGLIIQILGTFIQISALSIAVSLVGSIIFIIGLSFYAKAKARHPAWGLLGVLSIVGMIVLALVPDKSSDDSTKSISLFTKIFLGLFLLLVIATIIVPMVAAN